MAPLRVGVEDGQELDRLAVGPFAILILDNLIDIRLENEFFDLCFDGVDDPHSTHEVDRGDPTKEAPGVALAAPPTSISSGERPGFDWKIARRSSSGSIVKSSVPILSTRASGVTTGSWSSAVLTCSVTVWVAMARERSPRSKSDTVYVYVPSSGAAASKLHETASSP